MNTQISAMKSLAIAMSVTALFMATSMQAAPEPESGMRLTGTGQRRALQPRRETVNEVISRYR